MSQVRQTQAYHLSDQISYVGMLAIVETFTRRNADERWRWQVRGCVLSGGGECTTWFWARRWPPRCCRMTTVPSSDVTVWSSSTRLCTLLGHMVGFSSKGLYLHTTMDVCTISRCLKRSVSGLGLYSYIVPAEYQKESAPKFCGGKNDKWEWCDTKHTIFFIHKTKFSLYVLYSSSPRTSDSFLLIPLPYRTLVVELFIRS